jgi:hypothetical protein
MGFLPRESWSGALRGMGPLSRKRRTMTTIRVSRLEKTNEESFPIP